MKKLYQAISIIFHPILTITTLLLLSVLISFSGTRPLLLGFAINFGVIYGVPASYYWIMVLQKKIDFDVKNKQYRETLMKISVLSTAAALVLSIFLTDSETFQKVLFAAIANLLLFTIAIDLFKIEISVHVATLTMLLIFLTYYISPYFMLGTPLVILLAISRYQLKKHTILELILGLVISIAVYVLILLA